MLIFYLHHTKHTNNYGKIYTHTQGEQFYNKLSARVQTVHCDLRQCTSAVSLQFYDVNYLKCT